MQAQEFTKSREGDGTRTNQFSSKPAELRLMQGAISGVFLRIARRAFGKTQLFGKAQLEEYEVSAQLRLSRH